jgi:hypothetical protein
VASFPYDGIQGPDWRAIADVHEWLEIPGFADRGSPTGVRGGRHCFGSTTDGRAQSCAAPHCAQDHTTSSTRETISTRSPCGDDVVHQDIDHLLFFHG